MSLTADCEQPGWLSRYRFRTASNDIKKVLATFGYYAPQIDSHFSQESGCFVALFNIDTGPPALYRHVAIKVAGEGAGLPVFDQLIAESPVREGEQFDHHVYENFKQQLEENATRFGFFDASFSRHRVTVDPALAEVQVDLVLNTGVRFRFGEIIFNTTLIDHRLLRRYASFESEDLFDAELLNDMYQALLGSGYFKDVSVRPGEPDSQTGTVPVIVELSPGRTTTWRVGAGISTDLGPNMTFSRTNRLVNTRGHQTGANTSLSPVRSEVGGYYRIPQTNVAEGWFSLYGGYVREHTDTSESATTTLGVRSITPLTAGWVQTAFLEVTNDEFDVSDDTSSTLVVVPGISFVQTYADQFVARPRHAHRVGLELSGTSSRLGSNVNFTSLVLNGKLVTGLTERTRLLTRTRVGLTETDDFDRLPPRLRFFSGGDNRVRGFDFEEIGERDSNGKVIGGDRLVELSGEIDFEFTPGWAVAAFLDAGSVSRGAFSSDFTRSAGVGIRWYSPIGPLRLDLAKPLNVDGRGIRLHISLGPDI